MKAMVPTMLGLPPPGMAAGAAAAGPAMPLAAMADALSKDPFSGVPLGKNCEKPTKEWVDGKKITKPGKYSKANAVPQNVVW